jgi:hypothetical protein
MPPKEKVSSSSVAASSVSLLASVVIPHANLTDPAPSTDLASFSSPPRGVDQAAEKRNLPFIDSPSSKKSAAFANDSPSPAKKFVRNVVNISIGEWMERCPDPSVAGATGSGSTFAVVLCEMPTATVTTKRDMKQVAKKTILIGDDSGKTAELIIWGQFACRAWM